MRILIVLLAGIAIGVVGVGLMRPKLTLATPETPFELSPLEAALDRPVTEISLQTTNLQEVARRLAEVSGVPIRVEDADNWLATAKRFNFQYRGLRLSELLDELVQINGLEGPTAAWTIDHDQVLLAPVSDRRTRRQTVRSYDVSTHLARLQPNGLGKPAPGTPDRQSLQGQSESSFALRQVPADDVFVSLMYALMYRYEDSKARNVSVVLKVRYGRLIVSAPLAEHVHVREALAALSHTPMDWTQSSLSLQAGQIWNATRGEWSNRDNSPVEAKLLKAVNEFKFQGTRREGLDAWAKAVGLPLQFHGTANNPPQDPFLAAKGVPHMTTPLDKPIDVRLRGVAASDVLAMLLDPDATHLDWWYEGTTIVIGGDIEAHNHRVLRIYPLTEWIRREVARSPENKLVAEEAFDSLVRALEERVAPDSWRDNGGHSGRVSSFLRVLIVEQKPRLQIAVRRWLDAYCAAAESPSSKPPVTGDAVRN